MGSQSRIGGCSRTLLPSETRPSSLHLGSRGAVTDALKPRPDDRVRSSVPGGRRGESGRATAVGKPDKTELGNPVFWPFCSPAHCLWSAQSRSHTGLLRLNRSCMARFPRQELCFRAKGNPLFSEDCHRLLVWAPLLRSDLPERLLCSVVAVRITVFIPTPSSKLRT